MPAHRPAALVAAVLLLAGCENEAADLAREVVEAKGECTEEKLRAGDEACIQMMQRYAEMSTEAMHTYIGAVKSLDEALRRMPPPHFDTAGVGRALTAQVLPQAEPSGMRSGLAPGSLRQSAKALDVGADRERGARAADGRGAADPSAARSRAGASASRVDEWRREPAEAEFWRDRSSDALDPREGPAAAWGFDPRRDGRAGPEREREVDSRNYVRPPAAGLPEAPPRGVLLPPEQRLRRPWLREDARDEEDRRYRGGRSESYLPPDAEPDTFRRAPSPLPRRRPDGL